jgi:thiol-disulfide isomerase/thioredoxin
MDGTWWVVSYVALWVVVVVLSLAVVVLLRQIGVLHARLHPFGVHFGGEGPPLSAPAPLAERFDYGAAPLTLVVFTAPGCEVCARLRPSFEALRRSYRDALRVHEVDHGRDTATVFEAFQVRSTPYLVAVDGHGVVRGRGIANSLEQVEELVAEAVAAAAGDAAGDAADEGVPPAGGASPTPPVRERPRASR